MKRKEIATFAGGCFWCTEAIFANIRGVERVIPGYSGGEVENPSYKQVCSGTTGHAESIQITFDPQLSPLPISIRPKNITGNIISKTAASPIANSSSPPNSKNSN